MPNAFQQENVSSATTGSAGPRDGHETTGNEQQNGKASDTPERVDAALNTSSFVLKTLNDAAEFSPVPFLKKSAGLALGMIGLVEVGAYFSCRSDSSENHPSSKRKATRTCSSALRKIHVALFTLPPLFTPNENGKEGSRLKI